MNFSLLLLSPISCRVCCTQKRRCIFHTHVYHFQLIAEKGRNEKCSMLSLHTHTYDSVQDVYAKEEHKYAKFKNMRISLCWKFAKTSRVYLLFIFHQILYFGIEECVYIKTVCIHTQNFECWKIKFIFEVQKFIHVHACSRTTTTKW